MTTTTSQPTLPAPSRRWGCLKWAALAVVLIVGAPAGCTYYLFTSLANSTPAKMGLSLAEAHPVVAAKFGTPLSRGRFGSGSIQVNGPSGSANLSVPISGPKGGGTAHISATKAAGEWRLDRVDVQPDDGSSRISVLGGGIRS